MEGRVVPQLRVPAPFFCKIIHQNITAGGSEPIQRLILPLLLVPIQRNKAALCGGTGASLRAVTGADSSGGQLWSHPPSNASPGSPHCLRKVKHQPLPFLSLSFFINNIISIVSQRGEITQICVEEPSQRRKDAMRMRNPRSAADRNTKCHGDVEVVIPAQEVARARGAALQGRDAGRGQRGGWEMMAEVGSGPCPVPLVREPLLSMGRKKCFFPGTNAARDLSLSNRQSEEVGRGCWHPVEMQPQRP